MVSQAEPGQSVVDVCGKLFFMILICYIALERSSYYVADQEIMKKGFPLDIHQSMPAPGPGSAWLTFICDMSPAFRVPALQLPCRAQS